MCHSDVIRSLTKILKDFPSPTPTTDADDTKDTTMKLATLLPSIFAVVSTSAFSPISPTTSHLQSSRRPCSSSSSQLFAAMPICIVVEAEIKEDRMDEFLDMIEKNAVGSRAEPGCIRFGMY